jgi:glucose/arabinose dehydrogenase
MTKVALYVALFGGLVASTAGGGVETHDAFPMLSFTKPVDIEAPPGDGGRLFVVEQRGVIYALENSPTAASKTVFLDIQDRVNSVGSEEGLLGLAFHPEYADSGYFYVDYTAASPRRSVISRFRVSSANPDSADASSEVVLLEVPQPYSNHNGGQIRFGPEGYLWISLGDGGSGGDPGNNGQDPTTLLGSILRIDPDATMGVVKYGIPPDNPFVGNPYGYREEIYAYGLRNPWRFSFDTPTGRVWAGDVGQSAYEEVDLIESGKNYGWNIMEGFHCYNSPSCDTTGLALPVWEYDHSDSGGIAITGGFVYRGDSLPGIYGLYIYADYGSGRIWSLAYDGPGSVVNREIIDTPLNITAFGVDAAQELYLCAFDGHIYGFNCVAGVDGDCDAGRTQPALEASFPNPFCLTTSVAIPAVFPERAELQVVDARGRLIATLFADAEKGAERSLSWDGRDGSGRPVAGGPYFYMVRIGGEPRGRGKMILLR